MSQMTVHHMQGEGLEKTLAWAEGEVGGYFCAREVVTLKAKSAAAPYCGCTTWAEK